MSWEPHNTGYWLKSVGSADQPMASDWVESAPQELEWVAFPDAGKPSIKTDDLLVYYAGSPHQKLLGIVSVFTPPQGDNDEERWPWRCRVKPRLVIRDMGRCPSLDQLNTHGERDFRKTVMRLSHASLTEDEYGHALALLEAAADPERDIVAPGFLPR